MQPKTIIITLPKPLPPGSQIKGVITPKNNLLTIPHSFKIVKTESNEEEMTFGERKRKREKLDHLTIDQKILRRKLKNRVAAQTARDKKKTLMDDLEKDITDLKQEMALLQQKNKELKSQNMELESQNMALENHVAKCTCKSVKNTSVFHSTVGSAVGSSMEGSSIFNTDAVSHLEFNSWDNSRCHSLQSPERNINRKRTFSEMEGYTPPTMEITGGILESSVLSFDDHEIIDKIAKDFIDAERDVPSTPEVIKDILSLEIQNEPQITKEQIDSLNFSNELGVSVCEYDLPITPQSVSSDYSLDNDGFDELFSSLYDM